jgi:hypothetical protein
MNHIADHFEMNRTIEQSRPDFRVLEEDMWNEGWDSENDCRHGFRYHERPPCDCLGPDDYISDKMKRQRAADEEENHAPLLETSRKSRNRQRGKKPTVSKSKESKPSQCGKKPTVSKSKEKKPTVWGF